MGKRDARAIARLLDAVNALPDGDQPKGIQLRGTWGQWGRGVIAGWVKALGRDLDLITRALGRARRAPMQEPGKRAMEEALWRLDAAREKLHAAISLSLGVTHIDLTVNPVRFKTFPKKIEAALKALRLPAATELDKLGSQLAKDRAIQLRNELSHGVAPLTSVDVRCVFEGVAVRGGRLGAWRSHVDYPPSWRGHDNIAAETLWSDAVADVTQGLSALINSVDLLADLLTQHEARLPAPARIYFDVGTGRVSLSPPR